MKPDSVIVCQSYTDEYKVLAELSCPNVARYCAEMGYNYESLRIDTAIPEFIAWAKVRQIIRLLNDGYRGVIYLDVDVLVRYEAQLDKVFDTMRPGIGGVRYKTDGQINCGGLYVKSVESSGYVIGKMNEWLSRFPGGDKHEQGALSEMEGIQEVDEIYNSRYCLTPGYYDAMVWGYHSIPGVFNKYRQMEMDIKRLA